MKLARIIFAVFFSMSCMNWGNATPPDILNQGLKAESEGKWQKALFIYLRYLEKDPKDIELWLRIAEIEHHLKHDTLTIDAYQHAISITPDDPVLHKKLSEMYASLNRRNEALSELNEALRLKPHEVDYLLSRGKIANWNKNPKLALESYQEVLLINDTLGLTLHRADLLLQIKTLKRQLQPTTFELSPLDQALALANTEAAQHHYAKAIEATKKALQLSPKPAIIYKKLSELYAEAQQKKQALAAIHQATRLDPHNIEYLRAQGVLAAWNGKKQETQAAYEAILNIRPLDEDALLNLAHTFAWQGHTDRALKTYQTLVQIYPNNAEAWIQYAEVLSWVSNYNDATEALSRYETLKGKTEAYQKMQARILALIGRYASAEKLNASLIQHHPNDVYVLSTEVIIALKAIERENALKILKKLNQSTTDDPYVRGLNDIILTPLRTHFDLEADYTGATDTTQIEDFPVGVQYFINPTTSLIMQGLLERASATIQSGLETSNGHTSIFDESVRVGFTKQIEGLDITALIGALKIQNKNEHAIYDALVTTNLTEQAVITIESLTNLFRPYLVPQTPRSISLQVMENRNGLFLQWQPWAQQYLNLISSYSTLSDFNHYWHNNIWPKTRVYGSEHWLVSLGVDADLWNFSRRATDGYYSPLRFQGYEGTIELYYNQSENIGYNLIAGFGVQKDEQLPHFFYEEDLSASLFYGIYSDVKLQLKAGYTLRTNNSIKNYQCWSGGLVVTQRF